MFGRATIRLGIGPHSSFLLNFNAGRLESLKCPPGKIELWRSPGILENNGIGTMEEVR